MSRGKYLSLEEARKDGNLNQFIKEHPSKGDKAQFEEVLDNMAFKKKPKGGKTSKKD